MGDYHDPIIMRRTGLCHAVMAKTALTRRQSTPPAGADDDVGEVRALAIDKAAVDPATIQLNVPMPGAEGENPFGTPTQPFGAPESSDDSSTPSFGTDTPEFGSPDEA